MGPIPNPRLNLDVLEPQERYRAVVRSHVDLRLKFLEAKNRCQKCVLKSEFCVCQRLQEMSQPDPSFTVVALMNQREQYRSSNTVKVIDGVLGGTTLINGVDEDERKFKELLEEYSGRCFVLFPSEDSVEYNQVPAEKLPGSGKVLIIVADGTWSQARRLNLKIPSSIPRVKITPTTLSKFLCRRQTRADRVCTVEALSLLLNDMGKCEAATLLDQGLECLVEHFNMQVFGTVLRPESMLKDKPHKVDGQSTLPPRHPDSLIDVSL